MREGVCVCVSGGGGGGGVCVRELERVVVQ